MKRAVIIALTPTVIVILSEFYTVAKPFQSEDFDTIITGN